jgi:hypothetical protein
MTDIVRCGQHNLVNDSAWDDLRWLGRHLSSDAWFDSCYGDLDDVRRLLNFVREVQQPFAWSLTCDRDPFVPSLLWPEFLTQWEG